jgi:DNA-binding NtrC family response regulator
VPARRRPKDEDLSRLRTYGCPKNNVRELEHAIQGAVVVCEGETILPEHLPPAVTGARPRAPAEAGPVRFHDAVDELERRLIVGALEQSRGVKAEAARILGINANTLTNKMAYHGVEAVPEPPWVKAR